MRARHALPPVRADRFGARQVGPCNNPDGKVHCLLEGPEREAIPQDHAALGVPAATCTS
jgi:hypothetical protein